MLRRVLRTVLCLLACLLLYWTYAHTVVPLIEPAARPGGTQRPGGLLDPAPVGHSLTALFPADAWEVQDPKRLETSHGAMLFRDYHPRPDGTIELKPVTLIYAGAGDSSAPPILIQAPQGAVLQFDRPVNVMRADFGSPVGARLLGQIVIRRPRSSPEHDDEIFITTRNVKIDRERIWTPNDVEFRFGPHWGRGSDLQIQLGSKKAGDDAAEAAQGGVQMLELVKIEKILIAADDGDLRKAITTPASVYARPAEASDEAAMPLEVRCAGPFRFDFQRTVASLSERVRLTRRYPSGLLDAMNCERLDIHFAQRDNDAPATPSQPAVTTTALVPGTQQASSLTVERLVAEGQPVTFEAPSQNAYARAAYVECWYMQRRIVLEDPANAWLKHGESEMTGPRIDYTADPDDVQRLGRLEAAGPGRIQGVTSDAARRRFTATWNDVLRLEPHDGRHVLSLQGGARVVFDGTGAFSGQEMHLFLRQAAEPNDTMQPRHDRVQPDRLVVLGDIRIDTPQLEGTARRELKVWFVPVATDTNDKPRAEAAPQAARGSSDPLVAPAAATSPWSPAEKPTGPPLHFAGDVVEARVLVDTEMRLSDLTVAGQVRIDRQPDQDGSRSVRIGGDLLEVSALGTGQGRVTVRGMPAEAGAEGLLLRGAEIHCHQQSNMMWIPVPGEMLTPPRARPGSAGGTPVPPMRVTWGGSMQFDGRTVAFREGVEARGEQPSNNGDVSRFLIRGPELYVELSRRIDFIQPGNLEEQPVELYGLRFPGQVWLENRTHGAAGEWKSWEEMQVTDLSIEQPTGKLEARGPGWLSSVRMNSGAASATPLPGVTPTASKLIHIQVNFQRAVLGNLQRRDVEFFDRVRTTYGPVADWQQRLDTELGNLAAGAIELTSDRLQLAEVPSAANPRLAHHEIRAVGNVQVRGERFRAQGHELSYDDGKDLLILKSDGRGYATVTEEGGPAATEARTFYIWPKSKQIKADVRSVEFGPIGRP